MEDNAAVIAWLMEGDRAIRWQTMKDLLGLPENEVLAERKRIGTEGWGAALLSRQDEDGKWSGSLYVKKWVSTTYTLYLLKEFGLLPNSNTYKGCEQLFLNGIYNDEEIRFSKGQALRDIGVTGLVLGILCRFDYEDGRLRRVAEFLVKAQKEDGSWLYDDREDAAAYAFDSTLLVLSGLLEYGRRHPESAAAAGEARRKGEEFLLGHRLFQDSSGAVMNGRWLGFTFPNYWFYDVLAALEYFRESGNRDGRLTEAVEFIRSKRGGNETWKLSRKHPGATFFEMEQAGKPGRWVTLKCMRVLNWWDKSIS